MENDKRMTKDIFDSIITNNYGRDRVSKMFDVSETVARGWIAVAEYLAEHNMPFIEDPLHQPKDKELSYEIKGDRFKFAATADWHIGSAVAKKAELKAYLNYAKDQGVELFLAAGDLMDGNNVYPGQQYEQSISSIDGQLESLIEIIPDLKKCFFIIGNHEYAIYKQVGKNIGLDLASRRPDFKFLGAMEGQVSINGILFELFHGTGSGSYSVSYKLQKRIESYTPGNKPRFLIAGHWHQSMEFTTRNVTAYHSGSFQGPSTFSRMLSLQNVLGGWIVEVIHENGEVRSVKSEFLPFYSK
jgi:predicted phosphodiesterase